MKKRKKTIFTFIAVLLVLVIGTGAVLCSLALKDNEQSLYTLSSTDDGFLKTLLKGAAFGREFTVSETEFNTYINKKYCHSPDEREKGIDHIRIYFHKDVPSEIYAHFFDGNIRFSAYAKVNFHLDILTNIMILTFTDVRIGQLPISNYTAGKLLETIFSKSSIVTTKRNTASVEAKYTYELKNAEIDMTLLDFVPDEGGIICRTNSLTAEAWKSLVSYLRSDEGKEKLREIYDGMKDKLHNIIFGNN